MLADRVRMGSGSFKNMLFTLSNKTTQTILGVASNSVGEVEWYDGIEVYLGFFNNIEVYQDSSKNELLANRYSGNIYLNVGADLAYLLEPCVGKYIEVYFDI